MASSRAQSLLKPGGSSEALSKEDMRMVLNWESLDTLCLNTLGLN